MSSFGSRLKEKLVEMELTQRDLAFEVSVSQYTVSYWVNDKLFPKEEQLKAIAEFLDCDIEWLKKGDEPCGGAIPDKDIKRNASYAYDPTAYTAIKNTEREERKSDMEFKRGGMYEYETPYGENRVVLIVSDDSRSKDVYLNGIILDIDDKAGDNVVPIMCNAQMYAPCNKVSLIKNEKIGELLKIATISDMRAIDAGIRAAFGFKEDAKVKSDNDAIRIKQLEAENREYKHVADDLATRYNKLKAEMGKQTENQSVNAIKVEVERDFYKQQYEMLFERMLGK